MRKVLIAVVLLLVGYFVWRFVVVGEPIVIMTKGGGKRVVATVKEVRPHSEIVIEIDNDSDKNRIEEISLSKDLASQLKISPPEGFREAPLPLSKDEEKNKDMADFVAKYNRENLRWVGEFQLIPNAKSILILPVKDTSKMGGRIYFQYSVKRLIGGTISHFSMNLSGPSKP